MIKVKSITFAPADIFAMFATPQEVLAAPTAGYVNNILGISHYMNYLTTAYTVANTFLYGANGGGNPAVFQDTVSLTSVTTVQLPLEKAVANQLPFTTASAFYVTTDAAAATGDSDVTMYLIYEVKLIV